MSETDACSPVGEHNLSPSFSFFNLVRSAVRSVVRRISQHIHREQVGLEPAHSRLRPRPSLGKEAVAGDEIAPLELVQLPAGCPDRPRLWPDRDLGPPPPERPVADPLHDLDVPLLAFEPAAPRGDFAATIRNPPGGWPCTRNRPEIVGPESDCLSRFWRLF